MRSACSPLRGHCSSRVEKRSTSDQGSTKRTPGSSGSGFTLPKACSTPTWPASMTTKELVERARTPQDGQHQANQARECGAGPRRGAGLHAGGGGQDDEGDEEEDEAQDQAGHSSLRRVGMVKGT